MTKKMLIDTAHAEETRVVVVDGQRIDEFDFENHARKQLRGNIYLAKVTRVEPSLQAAFVEYGGNRHGFLAFNEIHPDYYQIPTADREALLREEAEEEEAIAAGRKDGSGNGAGNGHAEADAEAEDAHDEEDDLLEEQARRRRRLMRRYKIQEVIKRRQILLVQVVKEERGNKGAALTTYLSLAGRYCVLMPNTAKGGGISRKITSATDRKRLKGIVNSLETPQGMGLIVRTAGSARTKAEIKRDYEYLMRLWGNIRDVTLSSIAPALIYEEEDLVKRAIRDMYDKDYEGIWVEGDDGYREAREFMRMLMPSQAKKITHYREPLPLFVKHRVEDQLSQIHSPVVPLKSGGYLVINQTEALVAIDVNSGKSTRERNIESTALKTNLEAAEEAARQLRLRDLAGLIVIDFIDMDEPKNNRAVEKKLKDCMKDDRARLQMGKISGFGLMEISRQRRRTGVLEGTTHVCPHCHGLGRVRSVESSALAALRAIEIEVAKNGAGGVTLRVPSPVALYILNEKRRYLAGLEANQGLVVTVLTDESLSHAEHVIERTSALAREPREDAAPEPSRSPRYEAAEAADDLAEDEDEEDEDEDQDEAESTSGAEARGETDEAGRRRRRRRRRGGRRDEGERTARPAAGDEAEEADEDAGRDERPAGAEGEGEGEDRPRRRRRGRRGGRRLREEGRAADPYGWTRARAPEGDPYAWFDPLAPQAPADTPAPSEAPAAASEPEPVAAEAAPEAPVEAEAPAKPARKRVRRRKAEPAAEPAADTDAVASDELPAPVEAPVEAARPLPEPEPVAAEPEPVTAEPEPVGAAPAEPEPALLEVVSSMPERTPDPAEISAPPETPRRGWWRRPG